MDRRQYLIYGKSGNRLILAISALIFFVAFTAEFMSKAADELDTFQRSGALVLALSFAWLAKTSDALVEARIKVQTDKVRIEYRETLHGLIEGLYAKRVGQDHIDKLAEILKIMPLQQDAESREESLAKLTPRNARSVVMISVAATGVWGFGDTATNLAKCWSVIC
ncbi:hypothetical protein [Shimia sediminis]|uniref:hypothetical protein n=1 Tax=Shimia sediminis TaxID=2497945 RepID=UPI000F8E3455|nr:hypothetical protein [Shimia sediminis]